MHFFSALVYAPAAGFLPFSWTPGRAGVCEIPADYGYFVVVAFSGLWRELELSSPRLSDSLGSRWGL